MSVSITLEDRSSSRRSRRSRRPPGLVIPTRQGEAPEGEVLAIGPSRIDDNGNRPADVAVGDRVIYSKYGGTEVKYDGEGSDPLGARHIAVVTK